MKLALGADLKMSFDCNGFLRSCSVFPFAAWAPVVLLAAPFSTLRSSSSWSRFDSDFDFELHCCVLAKQKRRQQTCFPLAPCSACTGKPRAWTEKQNRKTQDTKRRKEGKENSALRCQFHFRANLLAPGAESWPRHSQAFLEPHPS